MTPTALPLALLALAFLISLVSIARGPTLVDRAIAAELAFVITLAVLALLAAMLESTHVLTAAVITALLQFIATAALAYLVAQRREDSP